MTNMTMKPKKKLSAAEERKLLILELALYAERLMEPAPSYEPRMHERVRASYHEAAMKLAALEVREKQKQMAKNRRWLAKYDAEQLATRHQPLATSQQ